MRILLEAHHPADIHFFKFAIQALQARGHHVRMIARDETDYWGLSHKEAGEWLNQYVASVDPGGEKVYKVHQRYSRWMLQEALDPERFEMWQPREGAAFFVSVTRFNLHTSYSGAELLHVVERQGVPLCFVFAFDPKPKGEATR